MPIISAIEYINGIPYLDGGVVEPIPIGKSIADGNEKHIIILTQDVHYRKKPSSLCSLVKKVYRKYPNFVEAFCSRHQRYNEALSLVETLEREEKAYVFRPIEPVDFKRFEKEKEKLEKLYADGYALAKNKYQELCEFLK